MRVPGLRKTSESIHADGTKEEDTGDGGLIVDGREDDSTHREMRDIPKSGRRSSR